MFETPDFDTAHDPTDESGSVPSGLGHFQRDGT